ncbi:hypothetical protein EVAR_48375_1, partial [Eumeta japonica]
MLSWINNEPSEMKMFVANRVSQALEPTNPSDWRYVPTTSNPADLISRGVDGETLDYYKYVKRFDEKAFIMTLKRFIARRGKSFEIFKDNGRNFVAAAKEIGSFLNQNNESPSDLASQQGIKFMFISTYALESVSSSISSAVSGKP